MQKNRILLFLGICGIATVLIVYLGAKLLLCRLDASRALTQITLLYEIQDEAQSTNASEGLCKGLRDALSLSPHAVDGGYTPSERSVEAVRRHVVAELILRLKQVTGKDFGPDPQRWMEALGPKSMTNGDAKKAQQWP
jgi:hypothetical protein